MLESVIDMARQKRSTERQTRPAGPMWTVDGPLKTSILERMREKGISKADLSREIKVTQSAITVFFREATKQSRLVPKILKVLDMVDTTGPVVAVNKDEAFRRLTKIWRDLSEAEREHLLRTGEFLAAKH